MQNYIEKHELTDKVCFWGRVEKKNIQCFWEKQDICVNRADYEGRSISIVEAMGSGAVPVVTNTSGVNEDIINGENGFIVPLGDYIKAADSIMFLYKHRELLPVYGKKAHDMVYPKSLMTNHIMFWKKILGDS